MTKPKSSKPKLTEQERKAKEQAWIEMMKERLPIECEKIKAENFERDRLRDEERQKQVRVKVYRIGAGDSASVDFQW